MASVGVSRELEKIFPSMALEVESLDFTTLSGAIKVASLWGEAEDWTYVKAPAAWPARTDWDGEPPP